MLHYYEVDWIRILTKDSVVDRILICMRDTTELNALKEKSLKHEKGIILISEFVRNDLRTVSSFLKNLESGCRQFGEFPAERFC